MKTLFIDSTKLQPQFWHININNLKYNNSVQCVVTVQNIFNGVYL
jgi:hypothetical protein